MINEVSCLWSLKDRLCTLHCSEQGFGCMRGSCLPISMLGAILGSFDWQLALCGPRREGVADGQLLTVKSVC